MHSVNVPLHRLDPFSKLTYTLGASISDGMRRIRGGGSSTQYLGLGRRRWGSEFARVGRFLPLLSPRGISLQDEDSKRVTESRCVLLSKVVGLTHVSVAPNHDELTSNQLVTAESGPSYRRSLLILARTYIGSELDRPRLCPPGCRHIAEAA